MPAKSGIGGTAVQLVTPSTPVVYGVQLRADPANSQAIYVGYSNVVTAGTADATDGIPLQAGDSMFVSDDKIMSASGKGDPDAMRIWLIAGGGSGSGGTQRMFYELH